MLGFGNVNSGFYEYARKDETIEIEGILVRDKKKYNHIKGNFYDDFDEWLDLKPQVVIEAMGGITQAYEYIKRVLRLGISVVTANKDLIAKYGYELITIANSKNCILSFEGAVAGGIPIISNLLNFHNQDEIVKIQGILNGTTNYLLSELEGGCDLDEALNNARSLGFAEADASSDLEGKDAARKACLLIATVFGKFIDYDSINAFDLKTLNVHWFKYARENDYRIKIITEISNTDKGISAEVIPVLVHKDDLAYSVNKEMNYVSVVSKDGKEYAYVGQGAGSLATGYAVYENLKRIENYKIGNFKKGSLIDNKALYDVIYYKTEKENVYIYAEKQNVKSIDIDYLRVKRRKK